MNHILWLYNINPSMFTLNSWSMLINWSKCCTTNPPAQLEDSRHLGYAIPCPSVRYVFAGSFGVVLLCLPNWENQAGIMAHVEQGQYFVAVRWHFMWCIVSARSIFGPWRTVISACISTNQTCVDNKMFGMFTWSPVGHSQNFDQTLKYCQPGSSPGSSAWVVVEVDTLLESDSAVLIFQAACVRGLQTCNLSDRTDASAGLWGH